MSLTLWRAKNGRVRAWIAVVLLFALAPFLTGCYGSFQVTKVVYKFNGDVSNDKFVRSLVMWGLVIVYVYEIAVLADAVVLNPIEFWNGTQINVTPQANVGGPPAVLAPQAQSPAPPATGAAPTAGAASPPR